MLQRTFPLWCLAAVVLYFTGCCGMHSCMYDGMAGFDACGVEDCGCGEASCGAGTVHRGPVAAHVQNKLGCGSGCGEVYWGEWCNDPPSCDPCDTCGNWAGGCGCWHPFRWLAGLWGYRYHPGMYEGMYNGGYESWDAMPVMEGGEVQEYIESPQELKATPKTAPQPTPAPTKQASAKRGTRYVKYTGAPGQYVRRQYQARENQNQP